MSSILMFMNDPLQAPATRAPRATWLGLAIALFGMLIARQTVSYFWPTTTFVSAVAKELGIWFCVLLLLVIIYRGEGLNLRSIGIGTTSIWKSLGWGFLLAIACFVAGGVLVWLTHYGHSEGAEAFAKLPKWLIALVVLRAGIVEELFFRGYAIERLNAIGLKRYVAAIIPLVIFALGHWTGGVANIIIAFVLGAILTAFYLWKRDLVANMVAHFFTDFVPNVILPLFIPNA